MRHPDRRLTTPGRRRGAPVVGGRAPRRAGGGGVEGVHLAIGISIAAAAATRCCGQRGGVDARRPIGRGPPAPAGAAAAAPPPDAVGIIAVGVGRADGIAPIRRRRPPGTCRGDAGRGTRAAAVGAVRRIVVAATMATAALPLPAHDLLQLRRHADTSGVVGGHLAFQYVCMRALISVQQSTIK